MITLRCLFYRSRLIAAENPEFLNRYYSYSICLRPFEVSEKEEVNHVLVQSLFDI